MDTKRIYFKAVEHLNYILLVNSILFYYWR